MELIFSLEEIDTIANQILSANPNKVLLFNGEMGVGKTTLIKSLAKNLGVNDVTSSPTFSLVNEYQIIDNQYIYHFDVYRLKDEMGSQVRVLKIDVDKNPDVADKFKIRGVPTFILFKKGEIVWRQSGGMDINTLKNKVKQAF